MDIFITDIRTAYRTNIVYVENKSHEEIQQLGYTVKFMLDNTIKCEIYIEGNETGGCREKIKEYILNKTYGNKGE